MLAWLLSCILIRRWIRTNIIIWHMFIWWLIGIGRTWWSRRLPVRNLVQLCGFWSNEFFTSQKRLFIIFCISIICDWWFFSFIEGKSITEAIIFGCASISQRIFSHYLLRVLKQVLLHLLSIHLLFHRFLLLKIIIKLFSIISFSLV